MLIKKYKNYFVAAVFSLLLGGFCLAPAIASAATSPDSSSTPTAGTCTSDAEPGYLAGQAGSEANCDVVTLSKDQEPIDCGSGKNGSFVKDCSIMDKIIKPAIQFLSVGFGIIVVALVMIGGLQYSSAGGDPQKVANAKSRIANALFALVCYLILLAALNYLIPGGLL